MSASETYQCDRCGVFYGENEPHPSARCLQMVKDRVVSWSRKIAVLESQLNTAYIAKDLDLQRWERVEKLEEHDD